MFSVLYIITMTQSIPNGFSMDELKHMLNSAPPDDESSCECDESDPDFEELIVSIADEVIDLALKRADGEPIVHKMIMLILSRRFEVWHENIAKKLIEEGEASSVLPWLKDAGHFQAINHMLLNISVGPNDFTCTQE